MQVMKGKDAGKAAWCLLLSCFFFFLGGYFFLT